MLSYLSSMPWWQALLIVIGVVTAMEATAYAAHRWLMHGKWGWGWHESHHQPRTSTFEKNDLYAVVFAGLSITLFGAATLSETAWLFWVAAGITTYGFLYFLAHDGLVHNRLPFRIVPKSGYLQRLYQAHRLHHAVDGREGCVSFGFLYAPPIRALKQQLKRQRPDANV